MTEDDELTWAGEYNAYERLGQPDALYERVLRPAIEDYRRTGQVPPWCGVDLLRGWAFYLFRADYFDGGGTLGQEWADVLDALRRHPSAKEADLPPTREAG